MKAANRSVSDEFLKENFCLEPTSIALLIYNINGRLVTTLLKDGLRPGYYEMQWQGQNQTGRTVASGIYFTVLRSEQQVLIKKMVLVK